jgi:DNA replication protein DnaC
MRGDRSARALALARGDGRHARFLRTLAPVELLILDDWGLAPMTAEQRRDLLEMMEDRHGRGSTLVTSQLPVEHWHEIIGDPTIADAILESPRAQCPQAHPQGREPAQSRRQASKP